MVYFDYQKIREQVRAKFPQLYPQIPEKYIHWDLIYVELKDYFVIEVTPRYGEPAIHSDLVAFHTSGEVLQIKHLDDLGELLIEAQVTIEAENVGKIVQLANVFFPQTILKGFEDIESDFFLNPEKVDKIQAYKAIICSPFFELKEAPTITFWAINKFTANLEQWEISNSIDEQPKVECKILETDVVITLAYR